MNLYSKKTAAFSLQELLVVLVIIGILLLLALPKLMPLISKTKSIEAQTQLKHLYTLQRQHFFVHSKYSPEFDEVGFEVPTSVENQGNANYHYEMVQASHDEFKATATAVTDFDGDGQLNVWEIDQEMRLVERVKD